MFRETFRRFRGVSQVFRMENGSVANLQNLKEMLDKGLVTQAEFDETKKKLLEKV